MSFAPNESRKNQSSAWPILPRRLAASANQQLQALTTSRDRECVDAGEAYHRAMTFASIASAWSRAACAGFVVLAVGCVDGGGSNAGYNSDTIVVPARIEFYGDPVMVSAPATASVDEVITVSITTYGGGCIEPDRIDLSVKPLAADIRPLDRVPADEGVVCTADLALNLRTAEIAFSTPGEKSLRFHGQRVDAEVDEAIVHIRSITIE